MVGLGPAGSELITTATRSRLDAGLPVYLRTAVHPAADAVRADASFDDLYETLDTFDDVYRAIVDRLVALAGEEGEIVYAVPGSPLVLERTVELLREAPVSLTIEPAMSFLDLAWARLDLDPVDSGVRLIDGHRFENAAAGDFGPLLVAHCHNSRVLSDLKLSVDVPPDEPVTVLRHLGLDDEEVLSAAWSELDRDVEADHLTSVFIERMPNQVGRSFAEFGVLVERLRRDCPWDAEQTHGSLRKHLLEETYEVLEAIDAVDRLETGGDADAAYAALAEELGDLLYQVFFHSLLAAEEGWFQASQVADGITAKLIARHPHVFGELEAADADDVLGNWEAAKLSEKGRGSVMDGIPRALPAALYASKVIKKARAAGISIDEVVLRSGQADSELSGELFALVGRCVDAGIDPESALREAANAVGDHVRSAGR